MTGKERRADIRDGILEAVFVVACIAVMIAASWVLA